MIVSDSGQLVVPILNKQSYTVYLSVGLLLGHFILIQNYPTQDVANFIT